jgi:hypothetical protein
MEPHEKAEQLFNKHLPFVEAHTSEGQVEAAIECALITVDECINASQHEPKLSGLGIPNEGFETVEYWYMVQEYLESMRLKTPLPEPKFQEIPGFEGTLNDLNDFIPLP